MKKYMIIAAVLVSGMMAAQKVAPKLEVVDNKVKATYYYDNGTIQQEGFFNNGKPDGKWVAYDQDGNKLSTGQYSNGQKTGKWFFWNEAKLNEVDYSNNQIAFVK